MTSEEEWSARIEERFSERPDPGWPRGEWSDEPDRIEWRYHEAPRFPLLIARSPVGALCGYVGLPPGHPWYGKGYDDIDVTVHGGLTYSSGCVEGGKICHAPRPGEPEDVWWLGFDCAHMFDVCPAVVRFAINPGGFLDGESYKTVNFVRAAVEALADQCARAMERDP